MKILNWFFKRLEKENKTKYAFVMFRHDENYWRKHLKNTAFNKTYVPPSDPIFLARDVIINLRNANLELQERLIKKSKELSDLKRNKNT